MPQLPLFAPGRRIAVDSPHTLAYPLVPLAAHSPLKPTRTQGDAPRVVVPFPDIAWSLELQRHDRSKQLPSTTVVDVLTVLLHYYHAIGMPDDGAIPFSRRQLITLMRWVPTVDAKPSGRHYIQLREALDHLKHTDLTWEGENVPDPLYGQAGRGVLSISLITGYRLADEPSGRRPVGRPLPEPVSWAQLDPFFVRLLKDRDTTVAFDLDRMMSLPTGIPRVLFRALTWYKSRGINRIPLRELFRRIGSTSDRCVPAKARDLLGKAHNAMVEHGFLQRQPVYEHAPAVNLLEPGRDWSVVYDFGREATLSFEDEQLVRSARAFGVSQAMAVELLGYRDKLREVLWAVSEGVVAPRSPAGYIVDATRFGWAVRPNQPPELAVRRPRPSTAVRPLHETYADWLRAARQQRLAVTPIDLHALRGEVLSRLCDQLETQVPEWQVTQEVERELTTRLGLPTYHAYVQRPDYWHTQMHVWSEPAAPTAAPTLEGSAPRTAEARTAAA